MKRFLLYDKATGQVATGDDHLLDEWRGTDNIIWVDLFDESPEEETNFMVREFDIHPMAIQDAQRDRHPPKHEEFDQNHFILLRGLSGDATAYDFDTIQLAMFVGANFFITRHSNESRSTNTLWNLIVDQPAHLARDVKVLPAMLGRQIVNRYLGLLFDIEASLDTLEQEMLGDDPNDTQLTTLTLYKTRLRKMSRTFTYHEQIFSDFRHNTYLTRDGLLEHEYNDTYEQMERVESLARLYYDLASDLIDSSISLASHRLNGIMKILTIITAIFVPLGFLAGLYGMNFEYIPELQVHGAYFILLSVMATIAISLLTLFRIKRWL